MNKLVLFFFTFLSFSTFAQTFEPIITTHHAGSVTPLGMCFKDDALFISGLHRDSGVGIIWKYDRFGNFIDSLVLDVADRHAIFELKVIGDSILAIGTQNNGDSSQLAIYCISNELEILWSKTIELGYYSYYVFGLRHFKFENQNIIHIKTDRNHFFRFDKDFNLLYQTRYRGIFNFEPIGFTDNGFIFTKWGTYVVELDTLFNVVDTLGLEPSGYYGRDGNIMAKGNQSYISTGPEINGIPNILYTNSNYEVINSIPIEGAISDITISRYTYHRTLLPNSDTSKIYFSGILNYAQSPHIVDLGCNHPSKIFIGCSDKDTIIWHHIFEDSTYYYLTSNMALGLQGDFYLSASRYNVLEQPEYSDAVIFRFSKEGELLVGEPNGVTQTIDPKIYPNPGKGYLQIKIANYSDATIQLYDLQGKIVQVDNFTHNTRLSTENLNEGIYFYRITTNKGTVYNGKWIKR